MLDQITALNTTTSNMIQSTSELLQQQSTAIHEQASGASVELDKLKIGFQNVYEAMDMMADYKVKALDHMKQTVHALSSQVEKAGSYVDRVREGEAAAVTAKTDLDAGGTVKL